MTDRLVTWTVTFLSCFVSQLQHQDTKTPRHQDTKTPRHQDTKTPRRQGGDPTKRGSRTRSLLNAAIFNNTISAISLTCSTPSACAKADQPNPYFCNSRRRSSESSSGQFTQHDRDAYYERIFAKPHQQKRGIRMQQDRQTVGIRESNTTESKSPTIHDA